MNVCIVFLWVQTGYHLGGINVYKTYPLDNETLFVYYILWRFRSSMVIDDNSTRDSNLEMRLGELYQRRGRGISTVGAFAPYLLTADKLRTAHVFV